MTSKSPPVIFDFLTFWVHHATIQIEIDYNMSNLMIVTK